jgi:hypothetical protein
MCVYMQIVVCIDDGWKLVPLMKLPTIAAPRPSGPRARHVTLYYYCILYPGELIFLRAFSRKTAKPAAVISAAISVPAHPG